MCNKIIFNNKQQNVRNPRHRKAKRHTQSSSSKRDKVFVPSSTGLSCASYFSSRLPCSCSSAGAADACSTTQTSQLFLRENSRKSGRRAMYAKWSGRPWRKPKLNDKFSCDAGGATRSHEGQRRPGVTFEHVDYNCDLCQGLCSFLSLSLSLCYLFLLSCSSARARDLFLLIPLLLLIRCFASSTSLLLYQREFHRQCPVIEYALGYYYGVLPNFEGVCGHWGLTCFERKIEWSLEPAESKQLPYRPASRTQYQLNKTTLHKFA